MAVAWSLAFPEQVDVGGLLLHLVSMSERRDFQMGQIRRRRAGPPSRV